MRFLALFTLIGAATCSVLPQLVLNPNISAEGDVTTNALFTDPNKPNLIYDSGTQQWAGHIEVANGRRLFYWFIESQDKNSNAPILFWMNGGPGCSSLYGLLCQWGPKAFIPGKSGLSDNKANLNQKFHILVVEQPVNVGFSYSTAADDREVRTSEEAAEDVFSFLLAFRGTSFNGRQYNTNELHIAGESFAGHYIPFIAERIGRATDAEKLILRLKSLAMGNAFIDRWAHLQALFTNVCGGAQSPWSDKPEYMLDAQTCAAWETQLNKFCRMAINNCYENRANCEAVVPACGICTATNYWRQKDRDMYDVSKKLKYEKPRNDAETQLPLWLNKPKTKTALGIPDDIGREWQGCNNDILTAFYKSGDSTRSSLPKISEAMRLLPDLRVLLYAGDLDATVPFLSIKALARNIVYDTGTNRGQQQFQARIDRPEGGLTKLVDEGGNVYGNTVQVGRLMYARIFQAGHMVNENRPRESKEMFEKWVGGFLFEVQPTSDEVEVAEL